MGIRSLFENKTPVMGRTVGRVHVIDVLRGGAIIAMVGYHLVVDLYTQGIIPREALYNPWLNTLQEIIACTFILSSGVSCRFSRNNFRRGLIMLGAAAVVSLVSYIFSPKLFIVYGVLHFLATAAILWALIGKLVDRLPSFVVPAVCLPAAIFTGFFVVNRTFDVRYLWILGIRHPEFSSGDYFPLMPYFFIYLIGTWAGKYIAEGRFPAWFYRISCKPLEFIGKHTIWIYLAPQPLCMGIALLIKALI